MAATVIVDNRYGNVAPVSNGGITSGVIKTTGQSQFSDIMNMTANSGKDVKPNNTGQSHKDTVKAKDTIRRDESKPKENQFEVKDTEEKPSIQNTEGRDTAVKDALHEKAEELVKEVADKLGVSEEEVRQMMELLGIQAVDLFQPDVCAQLVVSLMGAADMMSLVMDGELYGKLTELQQKAADMLQEIGKIFNLEPEVMKGLLEEMQLQTEAVPEETPEEVPESGRDHKKSDTLPSMGEKPMDITVQKDTTDNMQTLRTDEKRAAELQKQNSTEVQSTKGEAEEVLVKEPEKEQNGNKSGDGNAENPQNFLQGAAKQLVDAAASAEKAAAAFKTANTESIMKQIVDYMKIHIGGQVTEMEIQLEPANLGSIHLQIAMKNGAITAQLTAQNETVKQALETQLVQLREHLEEQGVKVAAVEVTVESHAFERNLQQGAQSGESEDSRQTKKGNRKRLILDEVDSMDGELEADDKLQVQMMKQSGNTVSFMA